MYCVVVANSPLFVATPFVSLLRAADLVIAADGGGNALFAEGIVPHLLVGDLDSIRVEAVEAFTQAGAEVRRFPPEKDETDLELALLAAVESGATRIDLLGALGGRWDQTLSNVALLALPELVGCQVRLLEVDQEAFLVRDEAVIEGAVGDLVSLLPIGGAAYGVTTRHLLYPLHDAPLLFERSRGVSNVMMATRAYVRLSAGMLLVVHLARLYP